MILKVATLLHHQRTRYDGPVYRRHVNFDPQAGKILIEDAHRDVNSIPFTVYHGRVLSYGASGVTVENIKRIIRNHKPLLERIAAGHTVEWNGNNHIGKLNDDAMEAHMALAYVLDEQEVLQ